MATKIPFDLLKGRENFDAWRIGAQAYLSTRKLWKWTSKTPNAEKADEVEEDTVAKGELTLLLHPTIYNHVSKSATTKAAWKSIVDTYEDSVVSQKIYTLTKFVNTRAMDFESLSAYVNEMMQLWTRVQAAGFTIDDKTAGSLMLGGLPEQYQSMVMGIENSGKDITVDFVKNLLLQDVLFDKIGNSGENALWSKSKGKKNIVDKKFKKVPKCYNCKGPHYRNKCPELKTYRKSDEKDKVLFSAFSAYHKSDDWYVDSGASSHMSNNVVARENLKTPVKSSVTAADGNEMDIIGMCDLKKRSLDGGELTLKNVHIVPEICTNLLSVSQMVSNDNIVIFDKNGCRVTDIHGKVIVTARLVNGLYKLDVQSACDSALVGKNSDDIEIWHKRLGHVNFNCLRFLNLKIPSGLKCRICIKGKQARLPFNDKGTRATKKLELIHSDVGGPISVQSIGGCKLYVTFIDDYTRKVFVYCLKNKGQVFQCFVDFKSLVENQCEAKIKKFRSDNGTEYINNNFKQFFQKHGIEHQHSAPYSPQQNGLAERLNRTLLDRVRCMLIDGGVARGFWAEALSYAAKIVNSVPCRGTGKIPNEMWFDREVDLSMFKRFGCVAFVHVPDVKRKKLDEKSIECMFVGISDNEKAYRLICKSSRKLITSRNVQFMENESTLTDGETSTNDGDQFFIELSESGGENADLDDSLNSTLEVSLDDDAEEQIESTDSNSGTDGEDLNDTVVNQDDTLASDTSTIDDTVADPTYRTRAAIDQNAQAPVTRSTSQFNLLNVGFAFCTHTPMTPDEACASDEKDKWIEAMRSELKSLEENGTWELVNLPENRKAIKNRWVYARKTDRAGNTIKYKARLVAKGFSQREGIDYSQTFAPVARYTSLRYILAVAAEMDLELSQMDAVSAFLNGALEEDIFMDQPPCFDDKTGRVCRLKRSIYGLKQSSRNWNQLLNQTLIDFGLTRVISEQCIYVLIRKDAFMLVMVWVDDILIAYNNKSEEQKLKLALSSKFQMKYLGEASVILGVNITRNRKLKTISIDQEKYIEQILVRFGMWKCNPISTPMDPNHKFSKNMEDNESGEKFPYREAIGSLLFAAQVTRPDINFPVILLSRFLINPQKSHWLGVKRIMRYLMGTLNMKLTYGGIQQNTVVGFCDSDYAADIDDRKSTSGYVFVRNGAAISWQTKKQPTVAQSTAEAEYTALSFATKEALWLKQLTEETIGGADTVIQMYCDNKGAVDLAQNNNISEKTKHIDIKVKFVHFEIERKNIAVTHVSTNDMLADVFTKALPKAKHFGCVSRFGLK